MYKILKIEIDGALIDNKVAAETYVDAFNLMYAKGLINDSVANDFEFIKRNKSMFSPSEQRHDDMLFLVRGSTDLWLSTYNATVVKHDRIKRVFDKYDINGKVEMIEVQGQEEAKNAPTDISMNRVKIYDVKTSASSNSHDLLSPDGKHFYWNDTQFKGNEVGDKVFFIERYQRWALCTEIKVLNINTTYNSQTNASTFNHEYNTYVVSGKYDVFVRFDIIEKVEIPSGWNYTKPLGQSEVYDLCKPGVRLTNPDDRRQKIDDLEKLFPEGEAYEILESARASLGQAALNPDIVDAINSPEIQNDIAEQEFHFAKAKNKLHELENFPEPSPGFFIDAYNEFVNSGETYSTYIRNLPLNVELDKYFTIVGQLISYCDTNAADKKKLNEYEDYRTLAKSFVRQTDWVKNLLLYRSRNNDIEVLTPSVKNAILYLKDPLTGITMLSENHRKLVAKYLLTQESYNPESFVKDLLDYFEPYSIEPANPLNTTNIINLILYRYPAVHKLWFERIGGLAVIDTTGWQDEAIEDLSYSRYIVMWWHRSPTRRGAVDKLLPHTIKEDGYFYLYYFEGDHAIYRARIVDFSYADTYNAKSWNKNNNVAWYRDNFAEYKDDTGKSATIAFLADEFIKLKTPIPSANFDFYQCDPPKRINLQPYSELNWDEENERNEEDDNPEPTNVQSNMNPKAIVDHAHQYMASKGFQYQQEEVANFYLALKTKPFVILAGISGTGKSQLPKQFAAAIGMEEEQVNLIPVRPDWTDGSELLGYTGLDDKFKPQSLTLAIKRATKNPDKPFFFILDEMNLARVEHYFSDFLSVIETRKWSEDGTRGITTQELLRTEVLQTAENAEEFRHLRWPDNLYLVGTVNMDETTHAFSRKVLDRANSIEMNEVDLEWMQSTNETTLPLKNVNNSFFKTEFLGAVDLTEDDKQSIEREMSILKTVNAILQKADLHFAYRVRDEVAFYLLLNKKYELMPDDTALDFQLVQKVLPRIHGSSERIQTVLVEMLNLLEEVNISPANFQSALADKIDVNKLKYRRSSRKIMFMLKRFDDDRFTSFWL